MRGSDNFKDVIRKDLDVRASDRTYKRMWDIVLDAHEQSKQKPSAARLTIARRLTMRRPMIRFAVAAAILITFGIGFSTGRWSKPNRLAPHSLDVTSYPSAILVHSTTLKTEDSFWRQKALAAMQPKPYAQIQTTKTSLLNIYKQYLREKHYD